MWQDWKPYVPVAERRANAMREMAKLKKKGHPVSPVVIEGKAIATTFWGKGWCDNLERYSDLANRLPRGRTYVRNGSVMHLELDPGTVRALVCGSELYRISIAIAPLSCRATLSAKLRTSEVLPIAGRAATMMKSLP